MSYQYTVSKEIIENVMVDLKKQSFTSKDSVFIHGRMDNPSNEIYYNDYSFLDALGHYRQTEIIGEILDFLKSKGIIPIDFGYSEVLFEIYNQTIKNHFIVPWKSFSPLMDKLLHLLSSIKMPENNIAVGVNCGYTLACLAGPYWKRDKNQKSANYHAIDLSNTAIRIAKKNIATLELNATFDFDTGDGYTLLDNYEDDYYDLAFLDTRGNFDILPKLYKKIKRGGWLLMHNASDRHFTEVMKPFLDFVRDKKNFSESILFHIDTNGLELSIKN